jgi:LDH2 family malate/lactate/ureidoglycolate dehydrogenase
MRHLNARQAQYVCERAASRRGLSTEHAQWFARGLVETSLMGIDTHGLRLLPLYLRELDDGRSNPSPAMKVLRRRGGAATLDADAALGAVAGMHAARLATTLAEEHGVGAVAVANSNHFGAASIYGLDIASRGMVGLVTTSAAARVAPFNGREPLFGTNPLCFAAPAGKEGAYLLDMATSQISYSQIKYYRRHRQDIPWGSALNRAGDYTKDPDEVVSLAPLGGYKGQGLAMMVQIMSCLLAGTPLDHELEHLDTGRFDVGRDVAHFMIAIDVASFTDPERFQSSVAGLMSLVRGSPAREGERVLVAGDPQASTRQRRLVDGIPATDEEVAVLVQEAQLLGMLGPDQEALFMTTGGL